jgi:hypothetical protein
MTLLYVIDAFFQGTGKVLCGGNFHRGKKNFVDEAIAEAGWKYRNNFCVGQGNGRGRKKKIKWFPIIRCGVTR